MELEEYCIGFERTIEDLEEKRTMDWLNKSNIAMPHANIRAIKDLIMCMDESSPNYSHLSESEKKLVQTLIENEKIVDTVLVTLFRWFGSHVGTYCLEDIRKEARGN